MLLSKMSGGPRRVLGDGDKYDLNIPYLCMNRFKARPRELQVEEGLTLLKIVKPVQWRID